MITAQLLKPECTSVIHENTGRRLTEQQAQVAIDRLVALPVETNSDPAQFTRGRELAVHFRLQKAYDTQYLAVAEIAKGELVTIDSGMRQRAIEMRLTHRFLR